MVNWNLNKTIWGYSAIGYVLSILIILISISSLSEEPNTMTNVDYLLIIVGIPIYAIIIATIQTVCLWIGETVGEEITNIYNKIRK